MVRIRRSSGDRWWSWYERVAAQILWPRNSSPPARTIRNWVIQAERDEGVRRDGPSRPEQEELRRLRRENKQLRIEREILAKATAWFAREADPGSGPSTSS